MQTLNISLTLWCESGLSSSGMPCVCVFCVFVCDETEVAELYLGIDIQVFVFEYVFYFSLFLFIGLWILTLKHGPCVHVSDFLYLLKV